MEMTAGTTTYPNEAARAVSGPFGLSVLIPFYGTSPEPLLAALAACSRPPGTSLEFVFADDGTPDRSMAQALIRAAGRVDVPCRVIVAPRNLGRSRIRNLLADEAGGEFLLFLDCDMRLPDTGFLEAYLRLVAERHVMAAYGGFVMAESDDAPATCLHAYYSRRSDCLPAAKRRLNPEKYTFTNNLLVHRDLMRVYRFDESFQGWGWEDVDWALSVGRRYTIEQIDNPVVNPGASTAENIIGKFEESVANFEILARRHPEQVQSFPIYRASLLAARVPFSAAAGRLFRALARDRFGLLPLWLRYTALKVYRACLYQRIHRSAALSTVPLPKVP